MTIKNSKLGKLKIYYKSVYIINIMIKVKYAEINLQLSKLLLKQYEPQLIPVTTLWLRQDMH